MGLVMTQYRAFRRTAWGGFLASALGLAVVLVPAEAAKTKPCGKSGSVSKRIRSCKSTVKKGKSKWELVARTSEGYELWRDAGSGLVWTDKVPLKMSQSQARRLCEGRRVKNVTGGLKLKFRLPRISEFKTAERHGMRRVLPNLDEDWFWSASARGKDKQGVMLGYMYDGVDGKVGEAYLDDPYGAVRCVARVK